MSRKRPPPSLKRSVSPPAIKKKRINPLPDHESSALSDPSPPTTSKDHIKIVSWNVNGTQPFLQRTLSSFFKSPLTTLPSPSSPSSPPPPPSPPPPSTRSADGTGSSSSASRLRDALRQHHWPHLLCLQEVKIAADDLAAQRGLRNAANSGAVEGGTRKAEEAPGERRHEYEVVYSLPRGKFIGFGGKVHGVATLVRTDVMEKMATRRPEWDLEGRILEHEFVEQGLVVVNGYWVNGTEHRYRNPVTGEVDGRTRHDLKLCYHQLILNLVLQHEREGKTVILVGDMNVAPARIDGYPNLREFPVQHVHNRRDFNDKFLGHRGMDGVDVFRRFHGLQRKHTWHRANTPHGSVCDRVDLIIAGKKLISDMDGSIVDTNICDDAQFKGHSDHCPLWVIVDFSKVRRVARDEP